MIFISSSMPRASIVNYIEESRKYGATLVLRGFKNNSLKQTVSYIKSLSDKGANVIIDPRSYRMFGIDSVPQIILISENNNCAIGACEITPIHDRIRGNVTLRYALERFEEEGDNRKQARALLSL